MQLNPSGETNIHTDSQEIPRLFVEPDGSLPCSKRPPLIPICWGNTPACI